MRKDANNKENKGAEEANWNIYFLSIFFSKLQTTPQILLIKKSLFRKSWPCCYTPRSNAAIEDHRCPDSAHKRWGLNPSHTAR